MVACAFQYLQSYTGGFSLVVTGKVQQVLDGASLPDSSRRRSELRTGSRRKDRHSQSRDRHDCALLLLTDNACDMPLRDVCYFVCDDACQFRLALRGEDQTGVDPYEAARQREGVDRTLIDEEKLEI